MILRWMDLSYRILGSLENTFAERIRKKYQQSGEYIFQGISLTFLESKILESNTEGISGNTEVSVIYHLLLQEIYYRYHNSMTINRYEILAGIEQLIEQHMELLKKEEPRKFEELYGLYLKIKKGISKKNVSKVEEEIKKKTRATIEKDSIKETQGFSKICPKNTFPKKCITICGNLIPNKVEGYVEQIWHKNQANLNRQLTRMTFQKRFETEIKSIRIKQKNKEIQREKTRQEQPPLFLIIHGKTSLETFKADKIIASYTKKRIITNKIIDIEKNFYPKKDLDSNITPNIEKKYYLEQNTYSDKEKGILRPLSDKKSAILHSSSEKESTVSHSFRRGIQKIQEKYFQQLERIKRLTNLTGEEEETKKQVLLSLVQTATREELKIFYQYFDKNYLISTKDKQKILEFKETKQYKTAELLQMIRSISAEFIHKVIADWKKEKESEEQLFRKEELATLSEKQEPLKQFLKEEKFIQSLSEEQKQIEGSWKEQEIRQSLLKKQKSIKQLSKEQKKEYDSIIEKNIFYLKKNLKEILGQEKYRHIQQEYLEIYNFILENETKESLLQSKKRQEEQERIRQIAKDYQMDRQKELEKIILFSLILKNIDTKVNQTKEESKPILKKNFSKEEVEPIFGKNSLKEETEQTSEETLSKEERDQILKKSLSKEEMEQFFEVYQFIEIKEQPNKNNFLKNILEETVKNLNKDHIYPIFQERKTEKKNVKQSQEEDMQKVRRSLFLAVEEGNAETITLLYEYFINQQLIHKYLPKKRIEQDNQKNKEGIKTQKEENQKEIETGTKKKETQEEIERLFKQDKREIKAIFEQEENQREKTDFVQKKKETLEESKKLEKSKEIESSKEVENAKELQEVEQLKRQEIKQFLNNMEKEKEQELLLFWKDILDRAILTKENKSNHIKQSKYKLKDLAKPPEKDINLSKEKLSLPEGKIILPIDIQYLKLQPVLESKQKNLKQNYLLHRKNKVLLEQIRKKREENRKLFGKEILKEKEDKQEIIGNRRKITEIQQDIIENKKERIDSREKIINNKNEIIEEWLRSVSMIEFYRLQEKFIEEYEKQQIMIMKQNTQAVLPPIISRYFKELQNFSMQGNRTNSLFEKNNSILEQQKQILFKTIEKGSEEEKQDLYKYLIENHFIYRTETEKNIISQKNYISSNQQISLKEPIEKIISESNENTLDKKPLKSDKKDFQKSEQKKKEKIEIERKYKKEEFNFAELVYFRRDRKDLIIRDIRISTIGKNNLERNNKTNKNSNSGNSSSNIEFIKMTHLNLKKINILKEINVTEVNKENKNKEKENKSKENKNDGNRKNQNRKIENKSRKKEDRESEKKENNKLIQNIKDIKKATIITEKRKVGIIAETMQYLQAYNIPTIQKSRIQYCYRQGFPFASSPINTPFYIRTDFQNEKQNLEQNINFLLLNQTESLLFRKDQKQQTISEKRKQEVANIVKYYIDNTTKDTAEYKKGELEYTRKKMQQQQTELLMIKKELIKQQKKMDEMERYKSKIMNTKSINLDEIYQSILKKMENQLRLEKLRRGWS